MKQILAIKRVFPQFIRKCKSLPFENTLRYYYSSMDFWSQFSSMPFGFYTSIDFETIYRVYLSMFCKNLRIHKLQVGDRAPPPSPNVRKELKDSREGTPILSLGKHPGRKNLSNIKDIRISSFRIRSRLLWNIDVFLALEKYFFQNYILRFWVIISK